MLDDFSLHLLADFDDDWYGLWEFDWSLNTKKYDTDPAARTPLLRAFAVQGLIDVFLSDWDTIRARAAVPLSSEEAVEAVSNYSHWKAPSDKDDQYYLFTTNEAGKALVQRSFANGVAPVDGGATHS